VKHLLLLLASLTTAADARVLKLQIDRRETILNGKAFGLAGPYEKLIGKVLFALDPSAAANSRIVDLALAPRNARGEVEFQADFFLLKPVDPSRGNGRLLYEVGNRGGKSLLGTFQLARRRPDPTAPEDFGDGLLMREGYALLWMGWQWDVPDGQMRMDMPIATDHGTSITGLVRGNFVPNEKSSTAPLADRNHKAYPIANLSDPTAVMTVRNHVADPPQTIARSKWHFVNDNTVALDGGFEPGRIYDVVYRARDPRVVGVGLAGTRDLIAFLKHTGNDANPLRGLRYAYGWGVSQSGRFLRHFLYEGFNADEQGRPVFDAVIDEVGGAGRGSFNHRFAQASRDAEQFFNFLYPVDMFPFTDGLETDSELGLTDSLLARAEAAHVTPKIFHVLSNSEYFNRAGALIHTNVEGTADIEPPDVTRIYAIAGMPHFAGAFPPAPQDGSAAPLNPLNRALIMRALLRAMDRWVVEGAEPPASRYPHISDGTLTPPARAGWPKIAWLRLPPPALVTYRLDFGPEWKRGIVSFEPPHLGKPYPVLVPAVDENGNARAGIRLPAIEVPVATYAGWNYRSPEIGAPDQFDGEMGSIYPFDHASIEQRYHSRYEYLGKVVTSAVRLVEARFLLAEDVPRIMGEAGALYDWAAGRR